MVLHVFISRVVEQKRQKKKNWQIENKRITTMTHSLALYYVKQKLCASNSCVC